ncbi:MAG: hypothetical protein ACRELG_23275, partial [Gemmataceae bacterium]
MTSGANTEGDKNDARNRWRSLVFDLRGLCNVKQVWWSSRSRTCVDFCPDHSASIRASGMVDGGWWMVDGAK